MSIDFRSAAARPLFKAWATVQPWLAIALTWVVERAPIFGRRAVQRRRRVVIAPYTRPRLLILTLLGLLSIPIGLVACFLYGFFFGLTAPYLIVPFVIPIGLLAALIIWALPDQNTAPTLPIEFLFAAFLVSKSIWPNYLAITLPGLPWITVLRLVGLPLLLCFLVSLSVSESFRRYTNESLNSIKLMWIFVVGFLIIQIITTPLSKTPFASAQAIFDENIDTFLIFVISCIIFRSEKLPIRYIGLICAFCIFTVSLTFYENSVKHIIWARHIPNFLHPPVPSVEETLKSTYRLYTNIYRAKAIYSTPLGLAEFISLTTPFFLYFGMSKINPWLRAGSFLMVPIIFMAVRMTDARLGVVGIFGSVLLYGFLWSVIQWRSRPRDLFAAATIYAYPVVFLLAVGAMTVSHRLKTMVLGGGAQAGSTEARANQLQMAFRAFRRRPWGYGAGQSGSEMGFAKDAFITVDNFFITIELDYGALGILFWYGAFVIAIAVAAIYCLSDKYADTPQAKLLAPLVVSLTMFLVIKWVHGQSDNHTYFYLMLGMISGLVYQLKHDRAPVVSGGAPVGRAREKAW